MKLIRGMGYVGLEKLYLPVACYAFPALIPTVLVLIVGWSGDVMRWFEKYPFVWIIPVVPHACFLAGQQFWSILSIINFYYR